MFAVGTVQAEQGWEKPSERISLAEACGRWIVSFSFINSRRKDFTCRNYQKLLGLDAAPTTCTVSYTDPQVTLDPLKAV